MVAHTDAVSGVAPDILCGFSAGRPGAPSPRTRLRLLSRGDHVVLSVDDESRKVVGFVTAASDGVPAERVPLFQVLLACQT